MKVQFDTYAYRMSHSKHPHHVRDMGCWAFNWNGYTHFAPRPMVWSDARAWAEAEARKDGARSVTVEP